jgi:hypothetical protein
MFVLQFLAFLLGVALVLRALLSVIRTFVLPRPAPDLIVRFLFRSTRRIFNLAMRFAPGYTQRDAIMALYGPIGLLMLVPIILALIMLGFALIFWGIGVTPFARAFTLSGSSLLTLGFVAAETTAEYITAFVAAILGMLLTAVLISYLPTIYSVFSKREALVTALEPRAGSPPWCVTLIERVYRIRDLNPQDLDDLWVRWTDWFMELEESHTSLAVLPFFRSQQPNRSWITAAGAILDTASLVRSSVDLPLNPRADLMIRSGYLSLKHVSAPFFKHAPDPQWPEHPIAITEEEFNQAYDYLLGIGVPMKPDRAQCWTDFAGWRVNYDAQLLDLCALVMAPEAPWSGDRAHGRWFLTDRYKDRNLIADSESSEDANSEDALPDTAKPRNASLLRDRWRR